MQAMYGIRLQPATAVMHSNGRTAITWVNTSGPRSLDTTPEQLDHHNDQRRVKALQNRASRTARSKPLASALVAVAKGPLMGKAYARTLNQCGNAVRQRDGGLTQYWCGYRWCETCMARRTAGTMARYGPAVRSWVAEDAAYLVTLTVRIVGGEVLRRTLCQMHRAVGLTFRSVKRSASVQLIRTTECTFSESQGTYHPHFHIVVRGERQAKAVKAGWLKRNPSSSSAAQHCQKADVGATDRWFRYATKPASEKRAADGTPGVVPAYALDTIYTAFRGLHLLQPVGVRAERRAAVDTVQSTRGTLAITRNTENLCWPWRQEYRDWVDPATGECLSGYQPSAGEADRLAALERSADEAQLVPPSAGMSPMNSSRWSQV